MTIGAQTLSSAAERLAVHDRSSGALIAELPIDDAAAVAAAVVARAGRAAGVGGARPRAAAPRCCAGRGEALVRDRAAIFERLERETGKARFDVVGELMGVCLDLGEPGAARAALAEARARQHAAAVRQARLRRLPAARRRRHHQPVERAAQSGARRCDAGAAGRQRGGHQALGAGAAGGAARLRGAEPRSCRPACCRW